MNIQKGTVVAITGASRGIGKAAAIEFAKRGAQLVLLSRDEKRMGDVATEIKKNGGEAFILKCDVSNEQEAKGWIHTVIEKFGRVDVLVNNAGYGHYAQVQDLSTGDLDAIFKTNLYGTLWCTQAVLPHMKKARRGHIVNVSTIISKRSIPYMTAYCMSKFAMNALDEGLKLELRKSGIRVSLVCPGLTVTDFQTNAKQTRFSPFMSSEKGMSAERVGKAIVRSVLCNKRRTYLTLEGKLLVALENIAPWLVDELIYLIYGRRSAPTN